MVETRRDGKKVFYRLAGDEVFDFVTSLRTLAGTRYAEVERIVRDFFVARDRLDPVNREELLERARGKGVVILDVRPQEEYEAGHILGAVSMPLAELRGRIDELAAEADIVAYCRGVYCVLAPQAVEMLSRRGFNARRLADGFPEWRRAGLPVATGAASTGVRTPG
jgi:ArsR family transcriptional regulator